MLYAQVNVATDGPAVLVPGVPGRRIRVVAGVLTFSSPGNVVLVSGAAAGPGVAGPFFGLAGSQLALHPMPEAYADGVMGHFETLNQGDGLVAVVTSGPFTLDQTGQLSLNAQNPNQLNVGGYLAYVLVP